MKLENRHIYSVCTPEGTWHVAICEEGVLYDTDDKQPLNASHALVLGELADEVEVDRTPLLNVGIPKSAKSHRDDKIDFLVDHPELLEKTHNQVQRIVLALREAELITPRTQHGSLGMDDLIAQAERIRNKYYRM